MVLKSGVFTAQPGFEESAARAAFRKAIPLRTLVIYCPDPRAAGIPTAVAHEFGEVWPGDVIRDSSGAKVGATTSMALGISAGGRAADALRSITTLDHMLGLENVVIVHHTYCGLTAFTPGGLIETYLLEQGLDLSGAYTNETLTIHDFDRSLRHDVALVRAAPGTPRRINVFGYLYDIDTETLTKVVTDLGQRQ